MRTKQTDAMEMALGMPPVDVLVMHKAETMAYKKFFY